MLDRIERQFDCLIDHYIVACIFLALIILTQIGVGDMRTVSMLGLLLCVVGIAQPAAQVDLWILLPLIGFDLIGIASTVAAYGNITDGYGTFYAVFPLLYLLTACLDKKEQRMLKQLCVLWTGTVAAAGIGQFLYHALWQGSARRMGGLLGNPNAMGIFLVVGWCVLQGFLPEWEEEEGQETEQRVQKGKRRQKERGGQEEPKGWSVAHGRLLAHIEPVLLVALTLTLSMGSFIAMAAGICALLIGKRRSGRGRAALAGDGGQVPGRAALAGNGRQIPGRALLAGDGRRAGGSPSTILRYACQLLAKAVLGIGTGMLLYLAAARSGLPVSSLLVLVYGVALAILWPRFLRFLEAYPKIAAGLSALGVLVAAAAVIVRPSAIATFTERLEMMQNGLHYLTQSPLLGVGPYKWRYLNLADSDKYFNTWHIHNVLLHAGVEFGWIAMGMLLMIGGRAFQKKTEPSAKAGFTAFCIHNMIDTSFFYLGITSLTLLAAGDPGCGEKQVRGPALKALFGVAALLFAYSLYQGLKLAP
ncbi:MAG: O-antigen ligase family protein [Lachnospiraceae bacterium]|nr:O-antigen ligase family protein [Lachnospiraceae bacterium]